MSAESCAISGSVQLLSVWGVRTVTASGLSSRGIAFPGSLHDTGGKLDLGPDAGEVTVRESDFGVVVR